MDIQSILFNKNIYTPESAIEWLKSKNILFKKFTITQYHIKFNIRSRIKLQNDGYILTPINEDNGNIKIMKIYKQELNNNLCQFTF